MQLAEKAGAFARLGTKVYAIAIQGDEELRELQEELGDNVMVLADPEGRATAAFGLIDRSPFPPGMRMARSASVYIDARGVVRYRWLTKNYRRRPTPDEVLRRIDQLR